MTQLKESLKIDKVLIMKARYKKNTGQVPYMTATLEEVRRQSEIMEKNYRTYKGDIFPEMIAQTAALVSIARNLETYIKYRMGE